MRTLIVTAANAAFMPLLRGLVMSLRQWDPQPYTALACLDVGLDPDGRDWVSRHVAHVVEPGWDLPVHPQLRQSKPHLRAVTARPFLPDYFPGYDVYLWIDADAWVQERFALDWYFELAQEGALAATPEVDRAYRQSARVLGWKEHHMQKYFGPEAGRRVSWDSYFNAGVFALRSDAPHWKLWARYFSDGLKATQGVVCSDQTALNYMLWTEKLPVHPLPALCNWACHLALPRFDPRRQSFCEPFAPSRSIGILHLTAETKDVQLDLHDAAGGRSISLRYPDAERVPGPATETGAPERAA